MPRRPIIPSQEAPILAYLANAEDESKTKGGDGWRTCREVADSIGLSMDITRRRLEELHASGKVDFVRDDRILIWHSMPPPKGQRPQP